MWGHRKVFRKGLLFQGSQFDVKYVLLFYYYGGMVYTCLHRYLKALLYYTVVGLAMPPRVGGVAGIPSDACLLWSYLSRLSSVSDDAHCCHKCHYGCCLQEVHCGLLAQVW